MFAVRRTVVRRPCSLLGLRLGHDSARAFCPAKLQTAPPLLFFFLLFALSGDRSPAIGWTPSQAAVDADSMERPSSKSERQWQLMQIAIMLQSWRSFRCSIFPAGYYLRQASAFPLR